MKFKPIVATISVVLFVWFTYQYFFDASLPGTTVTNAPAASPAWELLKESETRSTLPKNGSSNTVGADQVPSPGPLAVPWTQLSVRDSLLGWMRASVASRDNHTLESAEYIYALCTNPNMRLINEGGPTSEEVIQHFYGKVDSSYLLANALSKSKIDVGKFCKISKIEIELKDFKQTAPTVYSRLIRQRHSSANDAEYQKLLVDMLSNPKIHSLAVNEWLSKEMWEGVGKIVGPTYTFAQKAYAEDTLMAKLVGPSSDDSARTNLRCALFAKCLPASALTAQQRSDVDGLVAYVEVNIRQQRWESFR